MLFVNVKNFCPIFSKHDIAFAQLFSYNPFHSMEVTDDERCVTNTSLSNF